MEMSLVYDRVHVCLCLSVCLYEVYHLYFDAHIESLSPTGNALVYIESVAGCAIYCASSMSWSDGNDGIYSGLERARCKYCWALVVYMLGLRWWSLYVGEDRRLKLNAYRVASFDKWSTIVIYLFIFFLYRYINIEYLVVVVFLTLYECVVNKRRENEEGQVDEVRVVLFSSAEYVATECTPDFSKATVFNSPPIYFAEEFFSFTLLCIFSFFIYSVYEYMKFDGLFKLFMMYMLQYYSKEKMNKNIKLLYSFYSCLKSRNIFSFNMD